MMHGLQVIHTHTHTHTHTHRGRGRTKQMCLVQKDGFSLPTKLMMFSSPTVNTHVQHGFSWLSFICVLRAAWVHVCVAQLQHPIPATVSTNQTNHMCAARACVCARAACRTHQVLILSQQQKLEDLADELHHFRSTRPPQEQQCLSPSSSAAAAAQLAALAAVAAAAQRDSHHRKLPLRDLRSALKVEHIKREKDGREQEEEEAEDRRLCSAAAEGEQREEQARHRCISSRGSLLKSY